MGNGKERFRVVDITSAGLMAVNGTQGVMTTNNVAGVSACRAALSPHAGATQSAAAVNAPHYTISGIAELPAAGDFPGATNNAVVQIDLIGRLGPYPTFASSSTCWRTPGRSPMGARTPSTVRLPLLRSMLVGRWRSFAIACV